MSQISQLCESRSSSAATDQVRDTSKHCLKYFLQKEKDDRNNMATIARLRNKSLLSEEVMTWVMEFCQEIELDTSASETALNILIKAVVCIECDIVQCKEAGKLELICLAAISISAKLLQSDKEMRRSAKLLHEHIFESFSLQDLFSQEVEILQIVGWNLQVVTCSDYIGNLLRLANPHYDFSKILSKSDEIINMTLSFGHFWMVSRASLSFCILSVALEAFNFFTFKRSLMYMMLELKMEFNFQEICYIRSILDEILNWKVPGEPSLQDLFLQLSSDLIAEKKDISSSQKEEYRSLQQLKAQIPLQKLEHDSDSLCKLIVDSERCREMETRTTTPFDQLGLEETLEFKVAPQHQNEESFIDLACLSEDLQAFRAGEQNGQTQEDTLELETTE